jgi:hypothetical protein
VSAPVHGVKEMNTNASARIDSSNYKAALLGNNSPSGIALVHSGGSHLSTTTPKDPAREDTLKDEAEYIISITADEVMKRVGKYSNEYLGYAIRTNKQTIKLLISQEQDCCDIFGVDLKKPEGVESEGDLIGARVLKVGWGRDQSDDESDKYFDRPCARVEIMTDKGQLQIVAWNDHNGYYPHGVLASWEGYTDTQSI